MNRCFQKDSNSSIVNISNSRLIECLRKVTRDAALFSEVILKRPLRPYQIEPLREITQAVLNREGGSFSIMISRQGGKNEMSAHLETYLMTLFQLTGGNIIKCAPTFKPQIINSKMRLEALLRQNPLSAEKWKGEWSYIIRLGEARILFFSANENANVVGATAHIMMEFDEAQDISVDKHDRDFMPMASSTNCPRIYYGTAWEKDSLLDLQKQRHLEEESLTGKRRHFEYPWWVVAECNRAYGDFVESEKNRLGENHPMFRTQYKLETLSGENRFLTSTQLNLIRGNHSRQRQRSDESIIVAGIDIAGEDENTSEISLRAINPQKDSTVITIAKVKFELIQERYAEPIIIGREEVIVSNMKICFIFCRMSGTFPMLQ